MTNQGTEKKRNLSLSKGQGLSRFIQSFFNPLLTLCWTGSADVQAQTLSQKEQH